MTLPEAKKNITAACYRQVTELRRDDCDLRQVIADLENAIRLVREETERTKEVPR